VGADSWLDALDPNPLAVFSRWFDEAADAGIRSPETMTVATATRAGRPSARMALLKGHDERGFVFFTNRESRKADELHENPYAALVIYWQALDRQVRIEGGVERVDEAASFAYFRTRPRDARLAAWSSPQSRPLVDRAELERLFRDADERFPDDDIPLPPFWGGYRVTPDAIEFWQGRPNRFHDRARYERTPDGWRRSRLGP
jgi:pyridoxamine 5'-phosphate oxidase